MNVIRRVWFFLTRWRRMWDLDEEMRLHVEFRAAVNRRHGLPAEDSVRHARVRFGNPLALREEARDACSQATCRPAAPPRPIRWSRCDTNRI
jgi:hypothetical protein